MALPQPKQRSWQRIFTLAGMCWLGLLLAACTSHAPASGGKAPGQTGEPVTGRAAFQEMFSAARMWAPDAQPQSLESSNLDGVSTVDGKAPVWRGRFVSPGKREQRTYQYVSVHIPDGPDQGISKGREMSWDGSEPFNVAFIKTDSDVAFQLAQKHGGARLLKAHKDYHVFYDLNRETLNLGHGVAWQISFGENRATAPLVVHVASDSGRFLDATGPAAIH